MAHKKGGGSTRCGRDSQSKRLGVKKYGGEAVRAGNTFVTVGPLVEVKPGQNVGMGRDHTLFALIDGHVKFEPASRYQKKVSVYA